ncbi:Uncharacterized protein HZ326_17107 [Fusarium oxysporum f. sp. albedinis]|nr:Uncharacterized protein HZ326_17107 [Fusarium oxysporum f. sp. albedinis]
MLDRVRISSEAGLLFGRLQSLFLECAEAGLLFDRLQSLFLNVLRGNDYILSPNQKLTHLYRNVRAMIFRLEGARPMDTCRRGVLVIYPQFGPCPATSPVCLGKQHVNPP